MSRPVEDTRGNAAPDDEGFARLWNAIPDAAFRVVGVVVFLGFLWWRSGAYEDFFPLDGAAWKADTLATSLKLAQRVLIDITYLLIVIGFCARIRPIRRATDPATIALAMTGAFWPFLPLFADALFGMMDASLQREWREFMWRQNPSLRHITIAGGLVLAGLAVEVWGYAFLIKSLSIVPEARVLKTTGPYRFIRHPIYFGQFLAQAGVWLVLANAHVVWVSFYIVFVALQLVRTHMEDRVLASAFGETYRAWKRRTFWFT